MANAIIGKFDSKKYGLINVINPEILNNDDVWYHCRELVEIVPLENGKELKIFTYTTNGYFATYRNEVGEQKIKSEMDKLSLDIRGLSRIAYNQVQIQALKQMNDKLGMLKEVLINF